MRRKVIAGIVAVALGASIPVAFANPGGVPNNPHGKACPNKARGQGPMRTAPNMKGRKCGFNRGLTVPTVTTVVPTVTTVETTTTAIP
jgi:hypothetical protein